MKNKTEKKIKQEKTFKWTFIRENSFSLNSISPTNVSTFNLCCWMTIEEKRFVNAFNDRRESTNELEKLMVFT